MRSAFRVTRNFRRPLSSSVAVEANGRAREPEGPLRAIVLPAPLIVGHIAFTGQLAFDDI